MDIHTCIVDEISEGIQDVSWMTAKEHIIIKYAITYLTCSQKLTDVDATIAIRQFNAILVPSIINHKYVSKIEMKPCKYKYISSLKYKKLNFPLFTMHI